MVEENTNALFLKGLLFKKNAKGDWEISQVASNRGKFGLGDSENALLDQEVINRFCSYVATTLKPTLESFLEEEAQPNQGTPENVKP